MLFAYMACDEAFGVHEALEKATGVDWQTLFERLEWHGAIEQPQYRALMLSEETLEMLGSTLFSTAFAILVVSAVKSVQRH